MSIVDTVRRPEYTGENRCAPCTVVNAVIVAVAGLAIGVVSPVGGVAVLAVGAALVYLRGYVVPYTPQFAPRFAAYLPIDFGHAGGGAEEIDADEVDADDPAGGLSAADPDDDADGPDGEDVTLALIEAGVLSDGERLHLTDEFEREWLSRVRRIRGDDREEVADRIAAAARFETDVRLTEDYAFLGSNASLQFNKPGVLVDAATVEALEAFGVPERYWQPATRPLRLFLPECPICGGGVEETTTSECCGGSRGIHNNIEKDVLACESCGSVIHEFGGDPGKATG
jgi:hypothetical protein